MELQSGSFKMKNEEVIYARILNCNLLLGEYKLNKDIVR